MFLRAGKFRLICQCEWGTKLTEGTWGSGGGEGDLCFGRKATSRQRAGNMGDDLVDLIDRDDRIDRVDGIGKVG